MTPQIIRIDTLCNNYEMTDVYDNDETIGIERENCDEIDIIEYV
jgi:hypothetical protein